MGEREQRRFPDWVEEERARDLSWIRENLDVFWIAAGIAYEDAGKGAIFVDTTYQPIPGGGHPFAYFSREQVEELSDEDMRRMVNRYDPERELVLVLLKSGNRASTYRLQFLSPESQGAVVSEVTPNHAGKPAVEEGLDLPDVETLMAWEARGGCETARPRGKPSWLLKLGLI